MNFVQRYVEYLKDNPNKYWFRRKVWGWGWTPARWEGWLSLAAFIALFAFEILLPYIRDPRPETHGWILFAFKTIIWAYLLILLCYNTGEPPKWQWGFPDGRS